MSDERARLEAAVVTAALAWYRTGLTNPPYGQWSTLESALWTATGFLLALDGEEAGDE